MVAHADIDIPPVRYPGLAAHAAAAVAGPPKWIKLPPSELMTVEDAGNGLDFEVPQ